MSPDLFGFDLPGPANAAEKKPKAKKKRKSVRTQQDRPAKTNAKNDGFQWGGRPSW